MKEKVKCSFCGRDKKEAILLIAGVDGHICGDCIVQAQAMVQEEISGNIDYSRADIKLLKPVDIKNHLDEYVIGQDNAKKVLSVAVYNHYKRIAQKPKKGEEDVEIEKSNILMVGETGTGKTLLAKTIARILNVPFCIADATVITEAGYVGEDVESILSRLLQAADYNVSSAERGIVFVDEIDKISRKGDNPSITRDVSGEGVQQGLLKLIEGAVVHVPPQGGRKHPEQKLISIDTKNILFICGGAFDRLDKVIARRLKTQVVGYKNDQKEEVDKENLFQYVTPQDIKSYGLIPELVGRLPVLTFLNPLDKVALKRILTEPKNALIKQYKKLFDIDGVSVNFEDKALSYIVDKAADFKLGARGLRSICEAIMIDAMFELPSNENEKQLTISLAYAMKKLDKLAMHKLKVA